MKVYLNLTRDYVQRSEKMRELNQHPVHMNVHNSDMLALVFSFTLLAASIVWLLLGE
jgi:hypothetical protein